MPLQSIVVINDEFTQAPEMCDPPPSPIRIDRAALKAVSRRCSSTRLQSIVLKKKKRSESRAQPYGSSREEKEHSLAYDG